MSVLNWNPQYRSMSPNPFEKLDRDFAKAIYLFILYYKFSYGGFKTKIRQPILIAVSFMTSQFYSKTQNHVKHTLVHLLFRNLGFIWTMELLYKKLLLKQCLCLYFIGFIQPRCFINIGISHLVPAKTTIS